MADLRNIISKSQQSKEQWIENKRAEREDMSIMSDEGIISFTSDPVQYQKFLDLQADNPHISAGNIALAHRQNPDISQIASMEKWNKLGRNVNRGENSLKVLIPEKYQDAQNITRIGFKVGRMFDVTQTGGKSLPQRTILYNDKPEMEKALSALVDYCPVEIKPVDPQQLAVAAYSPSNKVIYFPEEMTDTQTFASLINEIVHAKLHNGGQYADYTRDDCELDANSVSYMVCRRFGIETDLPDAYDVAKLYERLEPSERRAALDMLQKMSEQIGDKVEREIMPPERNREHDTHNEPEIPGR